MNFLLKQIGFMIFNIAKILESSMLFVSEIKTIDYSIDLVKSNF